MFCGVPLTNGALENSLIATDDRHDRQSAFARELTNVVGRAAADLGDLGAGEEF